MIQLASVHAQNEKDDLDEALDDAEHTLNPWTDPAFIEFVDSLEEDEKNYSSEDSSGKSTKVSPKDSLFNKKAKEASYNSYNPWRDEEWLKKQIENASNEQDKELYERALKKLKEEQKLVEQEFKDEYGNASEKEKSSPIPTPSSVEATDSLEKNEEIAQEMERIMREADSCCIGHGCEESKRCDVIYKDAYDDGSCCMGSSCEESRRCDKSPPPPKTTLSSKRITALKNIGSSASSNSSHSTLGFSNSSSANSRKDPFSMKADPFLKAQTVNDEEREDRIARALHENKLREFEERRKEQQRPRQNTHQPQAQKITNSDSYYYLCEVRASYHYGCIKTYHKSDKYCSGINGEICINFDDKRAIYQIEHLCKLTGKAIGIPFSDGDLSFNNAQACLGRCGIASKSSSTGEIGVCHGLVTESKPELNRAQQQPPQKQQKNTSTKRSNTNPESAFDFEKKYTRKKSESSYETSGSSCDTTGMAVLPDHYVCVDGQWIK